MHSPAAQPLGDVPPGGALDASRRRMPAAAEANARLSRDHLAPRRAREFAAEHLRDWGVSESLVGGVLLVASELVTNAFRHGGGGEVHFRLGLRHDVLYVDVADEGPYSGRLSARPAGTGQESGRGLLLVEHTSSRWGHRPLAENPNLGKSVWAEFAEVRA